MKTIEDRLWRKVQKVGPDECWPWRGAHGPSGHGQIFNGKDGLRLEMAHCVAWASVNGPIPKGLHVCHTCDNPPCCNPAHLFLGTAKDNLRDAIQKGRFKFLKPRPGEANHRAKLTWPMVDEVRRAYASGENLSDLSRRLGLARSTLRDVVKGRNWRVPDVPQLPRQAPTRKLSTEQVQEMRSLHAQGAKQTLLARQFGVGKKHVSDVIRGVLRRVS